MATDRRYAVAPTTVRLDVASGLLRYVRETACRVRCSRDLAIGYVELSRNDGSHMIPVEDLRDDSIVGGRTVPPAVVIFSEPRRCTRADERTRAFEPRWSSSFKQAGCDEILNIVSGALEHLFRDGESTAQQLIAAGS